MAKMEKQVSITLELTLAEAQWIKHMVQNPMCDIADEADYDRQMRQTIWDALRGI